jgi:MFS family permease
MIGVFVAALMIGTLLTSYLAERMGRLNILRWCIGLSSVSEFFILGSGDQYYFIIFLFLLSVPLPGTFLCSLSYMCEITSGYIRKIAITFLFVCAILGYLPSYYLIYTIKSWRPIVLASLSSGVLCLIFTFFLVESPRYLGINGGRYSKARLAFEYIAKINKVTMFEEHLQGEILNEYSETIRKRQQLDLSGLDNSELPDFSEQRDNQAAPYEYLGGAINAVDREKDLDRGQNYNFLDLFREDFRRVSLTLTLTWTIISATTYSFTHSGTIHPKDYTNCGLLVLVSIFGAFFSCILSYWIRTKRLLIIFLLFSGVFTIIQGSLILSNHDLQAVYTIGLFFISGVNLITFEYTLELNPTPIRCICLGFVQFWAIIGMIVGYFIITQNSLFILVFGVLTTLLTVLMIKMPETGNLPLNDFTSWNRLVSN